MKKYSIGFTPMGVSSLLGVLNFASGQQEESSAGKLIIQELKENVIEQLKSQGLDLSGL